MAWIPKPSATAAINRRDEPFLTDSLKATLRETILPRYETTHAALLPTLHAVQHEAGWLPQQAMLEIAEFLDIAPAEVIDTATFYEEYWLHPKGRHVVAVCRSIACEFTGQPCITKAIKDKLGVDVGETTDDGEFTLIELECLGSCGTAPAALIDETLHENVTPESILDLIDAARNTKGH